MANHLEKLWRLTNPDKTAIVDAVIEDLRESYRLAMEAYDIPASTRVAIEDTVMDALTNNYDFLD